MARILVVDDSDFLAGEITKFLEKEHHQVVDKGKDGNHGVELFKEHKPDLALIDLTMPNKGGRDCLSEILAFDSRARVLIVSAIKDKNIISDCLQMGARGFIKKPLQFRNEAFCNSFREAVDKALVD